MFGPATIVHLATSCIARWSMWQSTRTHPVSLWVRTEGSMTSTSAWRWLSAPASSSVAVLSWRRRDSWGWPGRARWEQVRRWSAFNAKLPSGETALYMQSWSAVGIPCQERCSRTSRCSKKIAFQQFRFVEFLRVVGNHFFAMIGWICFLWQETIKKNSPRPSVHEQLWWLHKSEFVCTTMKEILLYSFVSPGQGGHAYLKEWLWWAGLLSSKWCHRGFSSFLFCFDVWWRL